MSINNVQLKSIKLVTNNSNPNPNDLNSTPLFSYTSDYAAYPRLTPEDLAPVPDPFFSVPVTPPRTPPSTPVALDTVSKIDRAFAKAALQVKHRDMASHVTEAFGGIIGIDNSNSGSWIPKDKLVLFYVMVFIFGVSIGLFVI